MPQSASSGVWVHVHVYIYIYRYLHIHMYADVLYGILSSEAPLPVRVKQRLAGVQLMPFWPLTCGIVLMWQSVDGSKPSHQSVLWMGQETIKSQSII